MLFHCFPTNPKKKSVFSFIGETELPSPTIQEEFRRLKMIKASGKIRQLEVNVSSKNQAIINFSTANNIIEEFKFDLTDAKNSEPIKTRTFDIQGHRSDARCLAFSSCNTAIASVSHETLKVSAITIIHEPLALDESTVIHMYLGMDTGKIY